jgi:high frequency lysogenization protein
MKANFDTKIQHITLALAGVFQVAVLVRDLAKTGTLDEDAFAASINSIYKIDPPHIMDVYGSTQNLRIGLQELVHSFGLKQENIDPYVKRYALSAMQLERKLIKNRDMLNTLKRRIVYVSSQAHYFSPTHETVVASLADIYINTLGTLPFRIQILGQAKLLNQPEIVQKVRALLLAGVRSAVLWRH